MRSIGLIFICLFVFNLAHGQFSTSGNVDGRYIENGIELPSEHYVDQPYVTICADGSWLVTMTTSAGGEGAHMNHIVATKSYDRGETWTALEDVEASGVPQTSWAVPVIVPGGRIYVFYNYNGNAHQGALAVMSGPFMYRYSDDHGKTWSSERYEVPMRTTKIDRDNFTGGKSQFFWCIDKPVVTEDAAYITYSKLLYDRPKGPNNYIHGEGFILKSENILTEKDPDKIEWILLPEGEVGINNPDFGIVQAEHNMAMLSNGDLYVVHRTELGYPGYSISRDGGKSFSKPKPMTYSNGNMMGNTRACPKIHRTKDGKFLFWFHNNYRSKTFDGRNPAWISGGVEKDGEILWSQPEIVIYDVDPNAHSISYPDFVEQDGQMWVTETQKSTARIHKIDNDLLNGLWSQQTRNKVVEEGLIMDSGEEMLQTGQVNFPPLPSLRENGGFSLGIWLTVDDLDRTGSILSTFGSRGKGFRVSLEENNAISINIHDGTRRDGDVRGGQTFTSDADVLRKGKLHHVVFTVDGAAKVVSIMVDGVMSDGGVGERPYGWGRLHLFLKDLNDTYKCKVDPDFKGDIKHIRVYDRYLRTSEAISNFNAGIK